MSEEKFIERKILIGLITSTAYIKQIRPMFKSRLMGSDVGKLLSIWCMEYFDKYAEAPGKAIEDIFHAKKKTLSKETREELEEDFLPDLSEEYEALENVDKTYIDYLVDETLKYFQERNLEIFTDTITSLSESGEVEKAQEYAKDYQSVSASIETNGIYLDDKATLKVIDASFKESDEFLIPYPKALGTFWNHQFIAGGFIAFLASEKRGKSFWLMDMAYRAIRHGHSVAFFQAGDMSETKQIKRFCVHLAKTSDMERYCGLMYEPVVDCIKNQIGDCTRPERECDYGIFENGEKGERDIKNNITFDELKETYLANKKNYSPCRNCKDFQSNYWGTPYLREINVKGPLTAGQAKRIWKQKILKSKGRLFLSTHANGTLSIPRIKEILDICAVEMAFFPKIIIIDYADLLVPEKNKDFRHQQNEIWMGLRNLSQTERQGIMPLVITATQADAKSYDVDTLKKRNFSEDKRKYAHVTALYGLNQDAKGREKKIGIMRINELVIREGDFNEDNAVTVVQNLRRGLPYISSYL